MSQTLIGRSTWTDDDGSGSTGTVVNNAALQADVYDKVDALFDGAREEVGPLTVTAQPRCAVTLSADFSINDSAETTVTWDTEEHDTGACHSTVTNTGRITVPADGAGAWLIGVTIAWQASATATRREVYIRKDGTTYLAEARQLTTTASGNGNISQTIVTLDPAAAAAAYYEVRVWQNSGGALNLEGGTAQNTCRFWAIKVA